MKEDRQFHIQDDILLIIVDKLNRNELERSMKI